MYNTNSKWVEKNVELYRGDCLEIMREIPAGSVDLVLADPPYGMTACKWDTVIPFDLMWAEIHRVVKPGGAVVLFGSEPFSSALRMSNIEEYKYDWIWEKEQSSSGLLATRAPLKIHENILVFFQTFSDVYDTCGKFQELKEYMISEKNKSGMSSKEIKEILGSYMGSHYFSMGSQFCIPSEVAYKKLQATGFWGLPFEEVKRKYEAEREKYTANINTYNPQMEKGEPYREHVAPGAEVHGRSSHTVKENSGTRYPKSIIKRKREKGLHPTQKPVDLLRYLIRTYTDEGEKVLDFCMGSGSTGVACIRENRGFAGIEIEEDYFDTAKERIEREVQQWRDRQSQ